MTTCLFCNIVAKKVPAQILVENDDVVAFRDIRPAAPAHALIIPKRHIAGVVDATADHRELLGAVLAAAPGVASELGVAETGYRLVINQGPDAGQSVFHLHCHVLGGRSLAWPPG